MLADYDAEAIEKILGLEDTPPSLITAENGSEDAREANRRRSGQAAYAPATRGFHEARTRFAAPTTSMSIEAAVEAGLPRHALRNVAAWLAGGEAAKIQALEWAVVPKTTLDRRATKLSVPESERTERLARLAVQARRALGTDDEARAFMIDPHPELDGRSPLEAARTDLGARRVERLLLAVEYGLAL